jgi:hypothetical protein
MAVDLFDEEFRRRVAGAFATGMDTWAIARYLDRSEPDVERALSLHLDRQFARRAAVAVSPDQRV